MNLAMRNLYKNSPSNASEVSTPAVSDTSSSKSKKKKKKAKEVQEASNNSDFEISSSTRDNINPGKTPGRPDSLRQGLFVSKNENVSSKISSSTKPAFEKRKPKGSWMVDRIGNLSDNEEGKIPG